MIKEFYLILKTNWSNKLKNSIRSFSVSYLASYNHECYVVLTRLVEPFTARVTTNLLILC